MFERKVLFKGMTKFLGGEKMKKVLLFAVLAMFLMVPMSFAKTAISESDLAAVTAQEGVTINFDCFTVGAISIDVQSWGDSDGCAGCGGYTGEGWVGATIDMDDDFVKITGDMTIDVGTSGTQTALIIGLPTLDLAGSMTQTVKLGTAANLSGAAVMGTAYMEGLDVSPTGKLIIYAH